MIVQMCIELMPAVERASAARFARALLRPDDDGKVKVAGDTVLSGKAQMATLLVLVGNLLEKETVQLEMQNCGITKEAWGVLETETTSYHHFSSLDISKNNIGADGAKALAGVLSKCK